MGSSPRRLQRVAKTKCSTELIQNVKVPKIALLISNKSWLNIQKMSGTCCMHEDSGTDVDTNLKGK